MDYNKINELKEFPFVKAFLSGHMMESIFYEDFNTFLKDQYFRSHFGFEEDNIDLNELRTLENALKFPNLTNVLKYNVILWQNLLLSSRLGCQVDILDFSTTRTGTHKYIKAVNVLQLPKVQYAKRLLVISAGNYAYSLIQAMKDLRVDKELVIVIDKSISYFTRRRFRHKNVTIIRKNLKEPIDLQDIYSGDFVDVTDFYDIELGNVLDIEHALYKDVGDTLGNYSYVICPTGGGELLFGLWSAYIKTNENMKNLYYLRPVNVFIPNFYAIIPSGGHEFSPSEYEETTSVLQLINKYKFGKPGPFAGKTYPSAKKSTASALVTPLYELRQALSRDAFEKMKYIDVENKDFREANKLAKYAGINSEISGSAGLVFMDVNTRNRNNIHLKSTDKILIVNTGNGKLLK